MKQSGKESGLGFYICKRRKIMGLTQEKLAERLGVSKSAVAKWETNGGLPDRDNLRKLAEILNVPVDDLHKVIDGKTGTDSARGINVTSDIIAVLENYGYKVIHPGKAKETGGSGDDRCIFHDYRTGSLSWQHLPPEGNGGGTGEGAE